MTNSTDDTIHDDLHSDMQLFPSLAGQPTQAQLATRAILGFIALVTFAGAVVAFLGAYFGGITDFAGTYEPDWTPTLLWGASSAVTAVAWALVD